MELDAAKERVRRYLLGQLADDEKEQFEERLLIDNELYEELSITEDELVDEYLSGELSSTDRSSFESHFLAVREHQETLRFARSLRKYVSAESEAHRQEAPSFLREASTEPSRVVSPPKSRFFGLLPIQSPALSYAMAVVLVLAIAGVAWLVWKNLPASGSRDPGRVQAFVLTPGLTRGEGETANRVVVPANIDTIRLQLVLSDNSYESYEAALTDSENRTLASQRNLKAVSVTGQPALDFDVAASDVSPGDYRVKVIGFTNGTPENLPTYSLRIQK